MTFVTLMSELLSSPGTRAEFLANREKFLSATGVLAFHERQALLEISGTDLERQAMGLILKRAGEVRKLLPGVSRRLGREFMPMFTKFAASSWPKGHKRHLNDALDFLNFLERSDARYVFGLQQARLKFISSGRKLGVYLVEGVKTPQGARTGIAVFWFWRLLVQYRFFYLSL